MESAEILKKGSFGNGLPTLTWGDLHHPQISLTNGKYDGEWLAVSDKSAGRVGIISMKDLKTKLIFKTPNTVSDHHAVFTDDSEWLVQSAYFPMPFMEKNGYAPLEQFKDKYRGSASFLKFDRKNGTIDVAKSFQIELPPYFQDMSILGRGPSRRAALHQLDGHRDGDWRRSARRRSGRRSRSPPRMREMDYLHVIDWKKALELVQAGKAKTINGIRVLPLSVAVAEGVIYFVPESKSPHGVDLVPGGEYVTVSGKLDPHVSVYEVEKIKKAIEAKNYEGKDPYGIHILKYDACLEAHVDVGLGPLAQRVRRQGLRLHLALPRQRHRQVVARAATTKTTKEAHLEARRQGLHPLQHRPPAGAGRQHAQAVRASTSSRSTSGRWIASRRSGPLHPQNLQLIDISGPEDEAALRHPDHRRAAQLDDHADRAAAALDHVPGDGLGPGEDEEVRVRHASRARSGSSARATPSTSTAPSSARTTRPTSCG